MVGGDGGDGWRWVTRCSVGHLSRKLKRECPILVHFSLRRAGKRTICNIILVVVKVKAWICRVPAKAAVPSGEGGRSDIALQPPFGLCEREVAE